MLKPSVGDITDMSSPLNFFSIVVFPALSKPLPSKFRKQTTTDDWVKKTINILLDDVTDTLTQGHLEPQNMNVQCVSEY